MENILVAEHTPAARWTDDCQGKKDYDGRLVSISTRYWPAGGGFHVFVPGKGFQQSAALYPNIKPSATAAIHINCGQPDANGFGDYAILAEKRFEGDTFEDVKAQVEGWVQAQYSRIVGLLLKDFGQEGLRIE